MKPVSQWTYLYIPIFVNLRNTQASFLRTTTFCICRALPYAASIRALTSFESPDVLRIAICFAHWCHLRPTFHGLVSISSTMAQFCFILAGTRRWNFDPSLCKWCKITFWASFVTCVGLPLHFEEFYWYYQRQINQHLALLIFKFIAWERADNLRAADIDFPQAWGVFYF